jgi:hypothetical protein
LGSSRLTLPDADPAFFVERQAESEPETLIFKSSIVLVLDFRPAMVKAFFWEKTGNEGIPVAWWFPLASGDRARAQ